jgi:hypothetical protein
MVLGFHCPWNYVTVVSIKLLCARAIAQSRWILVFEYFSEIPRSWVMSMGWTVLTLSDGFATFCSPTRQYL